MVTITFWELPQEIPDSSRLIDSSIIFFAKHFDIQKAETKHYPKGYYLEMYPTTN